MSVALFLARGSALRGVSLFLASPRKSKQKEGDPGVGALRVPCATRNAGHPKSASSRCFATLRARLAKLACGSDNASRLPPALLRCSAPLTGTQKTSRRDGSNKEVKPWLYYGQRQKTGKKHTFHRFGSDAFRVPVGDAEQRRLSGGLPLALSEPQASLASGPDSRVAQGTGVAGADPGVAFSLATFFWRSKRKYARPPGGTPSQSKPPAPALKHHPQGAPA